jgi:hypothetical protein
MRLPTPARAVAIAALLLVSGGAVAAAHESKALHVRGGTTTLTLDGGTAVAMAAAGFSIGATAPGSGSSTMRYPITRGSVSTSFAGTLSAAGGMRVRGNGRQAVVSGFVVATNGRSGTLSASGAGSGRFVLLNLSISSVRRSGARIAATGSARLSAAGARALNRALHTRLFSAGLRIGRAHLVAST